METSLEDATKRGPGEVTELLDIYLYWLIWHLDILFCIFQSGEQHNPETKTICG